MNWKMNCTGYHESLSFTGFTATNFTLEKDKRNGFARKTFFWPEPTLWDYFIVLLPLDFIDKIVDWTSTKTETIYDHDDIFGVFAIWFIYGLVTLPSIGTLYALRLLQVLNMIGIEQQHTCSPLTKGIQLKHIGIESEIQFVSTERRPKGWTEQDGSSLSYWGDLLIWLLGVPVL